MNTEKFIHVPNPDISKPFSIFLAGITYPDASYYIIRKKSELMCFEYIISGSGTILAGGNKISVNAGDSYMLLPGFDHEYFSNPKSPMKKIWFNATGPLIPMLTSLYRFEKVMVFKNTDSSEYIRKVHQILQNNELLPSEIQDSYTLLFHEILQFLKRISNESELSPAQKIKNYIDMHVLDAVKLSTLAKLIYRSESQTIRLFKSEFNTTPHQYILESKINHARNMLISSAIPVNEISEKLGFSDEHYFSNIFKDKVGMSPNKYRNKRKKL